MVKRLTNADKMKIYDALPPSHKTAIKKIAKEKSQKGEGIGSILSAIWKVIGPAAKIIGPAVLEKIVVPYIEKKLTPDNNPPPPPYGAGLKLAGQGKPKATKPKATKPKKGKGLSPPGGG